MWIASMKYIFKICYKSNASDIQQSFNTYFLQYTIIIFWMQEISIPDTNCIIYIIWSRAYHSLSNPLSYVTIEHIITLIQYSWLSWDCKIDLTLIKFLFRINDIWHYAIVLGNIWLLLNWNCTQHSPQYIVTIVSRWYFDCHFNLVIYL